VLQLLDCALTVTNTYAETHLLLNEICYTVEILHSAYAEVLRVYNTRTT